MPSRPSNSPCRTIAQGDPEEVPVLADPAPKHGISIDPPSTLSFDAKTCDCEYQGDPVTEAVVSPFESLQLLSIVLLEEGQVDVESHCQVPESVSRYEPALVSLIVMRV